MATKRKSLLCQGQRRHNYMSKHTPNVGFLSSIRELARVEYGKETLFFFGLMFFFIFYLVIEALRCVVPM